MKLFKITLIILLAFSSSCQCQEKKDTILLNYTAQTRGFLYQIQLKNNLIELNNNNSTKQKALTNNQEIKIESLLNEINFKEIESNISVNDLALDKAIKGLFEINFKATSYSFEFNHHKLPKKIKQLLTQLEEYAK